MENEGGIDMKGPDDFECKDELSAMLDRYSNEQIEAMFMAATPKYEGKPSGTMVCFGTAGPLEGYDKHLLKQYPMTPDECFEKPFTEFWEKEE